MSPSDAKFAALVAGVLAALEAAAPAAAQVEEYFVDDDAPPGGDGRTWGTAFRDLQDALGAASRARVPVHIRVGEGVYEPDRGTGERWRSFEFWAPPAPTSAVTLTVQGGFAGLRGADPNRRDPSRFVSVLSGDLRGDDGPGFRNRGENAYHVVRVESFGLGTCALEGLTITGGEADGADPHDRGGGVSIPFPLSRANDFGPVFRGCRVVGNRARRGGGGLFAEGSAPWLIDCEISGNATDGVGGGLWLGHGVEARHIVGCLIWGNTATEGGGVSAQDVFDVRLEACTLAGNLAERGAGVAIDGSGFVGLISSRVTANVSRGAGAALWRGPGASYFSSLIHCTLTHNRSGVGGVVEAAGWGLGVEVFKCVLRWNRPGPGAGMIETGERVVVEASNLEGGRGAVTLRPPEGRLVWEEGNVDEDPRFVDADGADNDPLTWRDNDERPGPFSPCIDSPAWVWTPQPGAVDAGGEPRFHDDPWTPDARPAAFPASDMGAHEFQGSSCPADCDGNLRLDAMDLACFQARFGSADPAACDCDASTGPGVCDVFDFLCFVNAFGAGCP